MDTSTACPKTLIQTKMCEPRKSEESKILALISVAPAPGTVSEAYKTTTL